MPDCAVGGAPMAARGGGPHAPPRRRHGPPDRSPSPSLLREAELRPRLPPSDPLLRWAETFFFTFSLMSDHCLSYISPVGLSAPTSLTDGATFSQDSFCFVLVLIPEEREPNQILFLASTSEINTSTSHSDYYYFLFLSPCSPFS